MGIRYLLGGAFFATAIAFKTCDTLRLTTNIEVAAVSEPAYTDRWYWNAACKDLEPSCVLLPASTQDVVDIVSVLKDTNELFAVKSGGHSPNLYFSSVGGGPLISTERLNEFTLDMDAETVRVGPGNRWDEVVRALDGTRYIVPGGRVGHVGVGGLLLGNGLSFLSAQQGWAASSIIEYDVVVANGSAVTVSETSHPDLFLALHGGGNNFGIVTSFLMRAYRQSEVEEMSKKLLDALRGFAEDCTDDKAAVILVAGRAPELELDIWILFTFYGGPIPPAGIFDNFTAAGPVDDTSGTKSYLQLLTEANEGVIEGQIYSIATETLPLPAAKHCTEVLGTVNDRWRSVGDSVLGNVTGITTTAAYQPFTKRMARIARERGGDLLDIDDDVNRVIMAYTYSHAKSNEHDPVDHAVVETYEGVARLVREFQESGKLPEVHLPLFMNDAYFRQDYFGRLKPERQRLAKKMADEVDAENLWQSRTGGFKP